MSPDQRAAAVSAIEANWRQTFRLLACHASQGHVAEHGPILTAFAGVPLAFFNQLFLATGQPRELDAALVAARQRDLPFMATAREELAAQLEPQLTGRGLQSAASTTPGMILIGPTRAETQPGSPVRIDRANKPEAFDAIAAITAAAFGLPRDVAAAITPSTMAKDAHLHWFLATADATPVACGLLAVTNDDAGLYNVAVTPSARGQGYGAAISCHLLEVGARLGCRRAVLQSSPMAFRLYQRLGFEHVMDFHHHVWDPGGTPG